MVGLFLIERHLEANISYSREEEMEVRQIAQQNQGKREQVITLSLINTRAGISTFHGFHFK